MNKISEEVRATSSSNKKYTMILAMCLIVVLLIVGSVSVFVRYSTRATSDAVHNVSQFYLEELGSNVSQVFKTHFDGYFKELRLALLATKETELDSEESMDAHLSQMVNRGAFLFYALLDEDGNIYISDEAYLSDSLKDVLLACNSVVEEVTLERREDAEDIFIIAQAAPAETRVLNGTKIVAGAKGISEEKVRTEILLRNAKNNTYAHMITSDGTYLLAGNNEKLAKSDNYFTALEQSATFTSGYSLESMVQDIQNRRDGSTTYYLDGKLHYGHYVYLPRSGWSLVLTVPFDTISATMQQTSANVTRIGILLMLLMVAVVSCASAFYIRQKAVSVKLDMQRLEAEERNRAKSSFLSSMSHDIRTPMNAIIGFTNLAMQQQNSARVQDYLTKISTSSDHLLSLINDVLDMSRIESGKMTIDETRCNLAEILHGLHAIIQGQVNTKQQRLYVDAIDVEDENVWCDKVRLNQVLLNFLSNAVKFTPEGGTISVLVIQKESARPGYGSYEFRVKDTGIGMSEEFSKKVFEPFERERNATVNGIQGTGLGMSIAKNIVDMMGGTVHVETELGKGTEFVVNVDMRLQDDVETAQPVFLETLKGMRVLVVDEDAAACAGMMKMLRRLEMKADWTAPGQDAVQQIKQGQEQGQPYQAFMIDWQIPGPEGLEAIRQIGTASEDHAPILLMSSHSWNDVEAEAKEAGVTVFGSKPLFMSDLRQMLAALFEQPELSENSGGETGTEIFEGKHLLLAEDNELNREIALEILQGYGFVVDTAENGRIAVEKLTESEPGFYDFILMDVEMPEMNGYEAARAIRRLSDPVHSAIPILAMTANAFAEDRQNSLNAGMDDHITKPLDMEVFLQVLKKYL